MATTEQIIRGLPVDFVRRMRNWARDNVGGGPGHVRAIDYGVEYGDGYREAHDPILSGEAVDTAAALGKVPLRYRQAVELFWTYEGNSMRWFGRRRGISFHTFEAWLFTGHELLRGELRARSMALAAVIENNRAALSHGKALIAS
jgi:hypothetical protein